MESENFKFSYARSIWNKQHSVAHKQLLVWQPNKTFSEHGNAFIIEIVPTSEESDETRSGCLSSEDFHDNTKSLNFPSVFPESFFSPQKQERPMFIGLYASWVAAIIFTKLFFYRKHNRFHS